MARNGHSTARQACFPPIAPIIWLRIFACSTTELEIMSVFFKPVPVCNFAQTPCLAALALGQGRADRSQRDRRNTGEGLARRQGLSWLRLCRSLPTRAAGQDEHPLCRGECAIARQGRRDELSQSRQSGPVDTREQGYGRSRSRIHRSFPRQARSRSRDQASKWQELFPKAGRMSCPPTSIWCGSRFRNSAAKAVGEEKAKSLETAVDALEKCSDVGAIMKFAGK